MEGLNAQERSGEPLECVAHAQAWRVPQDVLVADRRLGLEVSLLEPDQALSLLVEAEVFAEVELVEEVVQLFRQPRGVVAVAVGGLEETRLPQEVRSV